MPLNIILLIIGAILSAVMIGILWKLHHQNHPKALWLLFFTEMWERFSFYGMRALIVAYMTGVMLVPDDEANLQYGGYMALVYTMPLIGGFVADRYLGARKTIVLGGLLMAAGHLSLAVPSEFTFFLGLGLLVSGNGFFKPNISSLLGKFYETTDPRKDTAFSIFYMGINIGAMLGGGLCGFLGKSVNWHLGFGIAGIFMILGLVVFLSFRRMLGDQGHAPPLADPAEKRPPDWVWYALALGIVPVSMGLVKRYEFTNWLLPIMGIAALAWVIIQAWSLSGSIIQGSNATGTMEERCLDAKQTRQKIWAALILMICSVSFWGFFEQSGGSLNLMAIRNVDMNVGGHELDPLMVNNAINPLFIIVLTPVFAGIWSALIRRRMEMPAPVKFGVSFLFMAVGFWMFLLGGKAAGPSGLMPLFWFIAAYFFMTASELCISPIGLSVVSKLSPSGMTALLMGMWFLATAFGQHLAGWIGSLMAVPKEKIDLSPAETMPYYLEVCHYITLISLAGGVVMLACAPLIKRWMHGVK
jgi:POT family proton-dependent oligopeptide transporter